MSNPHVETARRLLQAYGADIRRARQERDLTLARMSALTGLDMIDISFIEEGFTCPGDHATEAIRVVLAAHSTVDELREKYPVLFPPAPTEPHARLSDPAQSDQAVKATRGLARYLSEYAREHGNRPFDTDDLVAWMEARHPRKDGRPWQRGTLAQVVTRGARSGQILFVTDERRPDRRTATNQYINNQGVS